MKNLNDAQLEFVKHLVSLAKEAINWEYQQGDSEGLSAGKIGRNLYDNAVTNPVVVLETYSKLFGLHENKKEDDIEVEECVHDKSFNWDICYPTCPPQYKWTCKKCGESGLEHMGHGNKSNNKTFWEEL